MIAPYRRIYGYITLAYSSPAKGSGWAANLNLTTRVFYSKLVLHRSVNGHSLYRLKY